MILKGSQRAGGMQLAKHLLNMKDNDHVTVHEVSGFVSSDLHLALKEAYAVSRGTRCKQFLFSLSLSPPETETVPVEVFEKAITDIEERIGLAGQPRAVVFHEKEGRRHAHCVWSRIDIETMTAINLSHYKLKLKDISRQLYIENKWRMPSGLANSVEANPLNFSGAQWQQAKRIKSDPRTIKTAFQDSWAMSDSLRAFRNALEARGYYLAQGDRRGFVAVDWHGEIYAVSRWTGVKTKEVKAKLGSPEALPSVEETRKAIAEQIEQKILRFTSEMKWEFEHAQEGLQAKRKALVLRQRTERKRLAEKHSERTIAEARQRAEKIRKGLAGLWDWVRGKRAEVRKANKTELAACQTRDRTEQEHLINRHLEERHDLQQQIRNMRRRYEMEKTVLLDPDRDDKIEEQNRKQLRMAVAFRLQ